MLFDCFNIRTSGYRGNAVHQSSMCQRRESNLEPLGHESSVVTTKPGCYPIDLVKIYVENFIEPKFKTQ